MKLYVAPDETQSKFETCRDRVQQQANEKLKYQTNALFSNPRHGKNISWISKARRSNSLNQLASLQGKCLGNKFHISKLIMSAKCNAFAKLLAYMSADCIAYDPSIKSQSVTVLTIAKLHFRTSFFIVPDGNVYMMRTLFNHYIWLHFFYTPINLRLQKQ